MFRFVGLCFGMLVRLFRGRQILLLENLALRQQLVMLKRQAGSAFALMYRLLRRSCTPMGVFVISPVPTFLLESLLTAGSLRSTAITPLHSYCGPLRHPLAFHRFPGFASYAASLLPPSFMAGRGGLLQLLDISLSPCCPYHPAGVSCRLGQPATCHAAFAPKQGARPPDLILFRGHLWVYFRYGPVTRSPSL